MILRTTLSVAAGVLVFGSHAFGHTSYTGYSGAPGSRGRCASSCHGNSGGTIQISGFPSVYTPGEVYTITVSHTGGNSIRQFNGSCRIGTGSENAGVIAAGTNTVTYNRSEETNGVHLSSSNLDNATFEWTAPEGGTGEVRLYIAGLQGSYGGQNSTLTLVSDELVTDLGDDDQNEIPSSFKLETIYPNPFNAATKIRFNLASNSDIIIEVFDLLGGRVAILAKGNYGAGIHEVLWDASDLSTGVYFCRLRAGDSVDTRRLLLLK